MSTGVQDARSFRDLISVEADGSYRFSQIFSDQGWRARRRSKKTFKLLKKIDGALRAMLRDGEQAFFVSHGTVSLSFVEWYFLGWALHSLNRRAIILTNQRILLLQINWRQRPRHSAVAFSDSDGQQVNTLKALSRNAVLCRGLGRSYGDAALPPPGHLEVATTTLADRVLAFDETSGILRAEAGLSLQELNRLFLPRRWFTPVTPGTQYVTLGGMVAADIHGKNHHVEGTFGRHVRAILLRVADGRLIECSPSHEPELFWASVGGMGLTGHILEVEFQMQTRQRHRPGRTTHRPRHSC